jgi:pimeloyl-ACP methyl ester carboxylesterase
LGSPVAYNTALMRPDLVRGVLMMCAPPAARGPIRPNDAWNQIYKGLNFYQSYLGTPEAKAEIMSGLRRFLLGVSIRPQGLAPSTTSGGGSGNRPRPSPRRTVPETLPPFLSQQALDCYVGEFTWTGIEPANDWCTAIDTGWENTSFLDGAVVEQPALFLTGEHDPSLRTVRGVDRQGPAFRSLQTNFRDMREIITVPGAGHTPPEKKPEEINAIVLKFLRDIGN